MYKFPCTFMQTFLISGSHMLIFISELRYSNGGLLVYMFISAIAGMKWIVP